jgi:hypothetical protein
MLVAMRWLAVLTALIGFWLLPAAPAEAESPGIRRHGPACPPAGCAGASRSSTTATAGFAAAVLATGLAARRGRGLTR